MFTSFPSKVSINSSERILIYPASTTKSGFSFFIISEIYMSYPLLVSKKEGSKNFAFIPLFFAISRAPAFFLLDNTSFTFAFILPSSIAFNIAFKLLPLPDARTTKLQVILSPYHSKRFKPNDNIIINHF